MIWTKVLKRSPDMRPSSPLADPVAEHRAQPNDQSDGPKVGAKQSQRHECHELDDLHGERTRRLRSDHAFFQDVRLQIDRVHDRPRGADQCGNNRGEEGREGKVDRPRRRHLHLPTHQVRSGVEHQKGSEQQVQPARFESSQQGGTE